MKKSSMINTLHVVLNLKIILLIVGILGGEFLIMKLLKLCTTILAINLSGLLGEWMKDLVISGLRRCLGNPWITGFI